MTGGPAPYPAAPEMPEAQEQPSTRSRVKDGVIEIVTTVGLAIILYLIITTFVVQTFRVEQQSMTDTLQPGGHLLIDKLTPRFDAYSRGDIVVFHPNGDSDSTPFIKRVIGVGGETLEIRDGFVWIDGIQLDEEYTRLLESTEPARLGGLVGGHRPRLAAQAPAVEPDDAGGHGVDEGAVVRDQHQRPAPAIEQVLQPLDGVDVQMVGWLIQDHYFGISQQCSPDGKPLLHPQRIALRKVIGKLTKFEVCDFFRDPPRGHVPRHAEHVGDEPEKLPARQLVVKTRLVGHVAEMQVGFPR